MTYYPRPWIIQDLEREASELTEKIERLRDDFSKDKLTSCQLHQDVIMWGQRRNFLTSRILDFEQRLSDRVRRLLRYQSLVR